MDFCSYGACMVFSPCHVFFHLMSCESFFKADDYSFPLLSNTTFFCKHFFPYEVAGLDIPLGSSSSYLASQVGTLKISCKHFANGSKKIIISDEPRDHCLFQTKHPHLFAPRPLSKFFATSESSV